MGEQEAIVLALLLEYPIQHEVIPHAAYGLAFGEVDKALASRRFSYRLDHPVRKGIKVSIVLVHTKAEAYCKYDP